MEIRFEDMQGDGTGILNTYRLHRHEVMEKCAAVRADIPRKSRSGFDTAREDYYQLNADGIRADSIAETMAWPPSQNQSTGNTRERIAQKFVRAIRKLKGCTTTRDCMDELWECLDSGQRDGESSEIQR